MKLRISTIAVAVALVCVSNVYATEIVEGAKHAGKETVQAAKEAGSAIKEGTKKLGHEIVEGSKKAGKEIREDLGKAGQKLKGAVKGGDKGNTAGTPGE